MQVGPLPPSTQVGLQLASVPVGLLLTSLQLSRFPPWPGDSVGRVTCLLIELGLGSGLASGSWLEFMVRVEVRFLASESVSGLGPGSIQGQCHIQAQAQAQRQCQGQV